MQIETSRRYNLTQARMAVDGNSTSNKCCRGCEATGTLLHGCWEWKKDIFLPWKPITVQRWFDIFFLKFLASLASIYSEDQGKRQM